MLDIFQCVAELVDTFYNLVTDVYEWGWGQSFHFSPLLPGNTIWRLLLSQTVFSSADELCSIALQKMTIVDTTLMIASWSSELALHARAGVGFQQPNHCPQDITGLHLARYASSVNVSSPV